MKKQMLMLATVVSAAVAQAELIHHWAFDEGTGTTASDSAGANDGAINGATWATGTGDRASYLSFSGTPSNVDPSLVLPVMTTDVDFTWAVWANSALDPTLASQRNTIILGNRKDGANTDYSPREFIKLTPTKFEWRPQDTGGISANYTDVTQDSWVHLAVVKSGTNFQSYVNGVADAVLTNDLNYTSAMAFFIGGEPNNSAANEYFKGGIDDVRLYDHALDASEVAALIPEPGTLGLVAVFGGGILFFRRRFMM